MKRSDQYITLRNAIDLIQSGQLFAFKAVTFDEKRKKGGKFIEHRQARIFGKFEGDTSVDFKAAFEVANPQKTGFDTQNATLETQNPKNTEGSEKIPRNPHHSLFMTRNVQVYADGRPTSRKLKIHLDLLVRVDGKRVLLP